WCWPSLRWWTGATWATWPASCRSSPTGCCAWPWATSRRRRRAVPGLRRAARCATGRESCQWRAHGCRSGQVPPRCAITPMNAATAAFASRWRPFVHPRVAGLLPWRNRRTMRRLWRESRARWPGNCRPARRLIRLIASRYEMAILRMTDLDLSGKRVLIRQDLNVPLDNGRITSDQRIVASLPTLRRALEQGAAVMVAAHLGRPVEGEWSEEFSLAPVARRL